MTSSVTIVLLTLNAEKRISKILSKIDFTKYDVLIIDSSSEDSTTLLAKEYGCRVEVIQRENFNHGATREFARSLLTSDVIVFLTDDAIPLSGQSIDKLVEPIRNGEAGVSYARQIPREKANIFEAFPREFNYPDGAMVRSIKDTKKYGVYTFFCSNSCAAWSNEALDRIGGFKSTLTNEDYFACAELLNKGYKVAYVPTATFTHSHNYSLKEDFQRMFDTGYVRAENKYIQTIVGTANKRGAQYFKKFIKKLLFKAPYLITYAIVQTASKYVGYYVGFRSLSAPTWFKKICSGQKYYWDSMYYQDKL